MYGQVSITPNFIGGVNKEVFLELEFVAEDTINLTPAYKGPVLYVYAKQEDTERQRIDSIWQARKEDVRPFEGETEEKALERMSIQIGNRVAAYLLALGVTGEQINSVPATDSFAQWVQSVIALLPANYQELKCDVILTYNKKGYLSTPSGYTPRSRKYGIFVVPTGTPMQVTSGYAKGVIPPVENTQPNGASASTPPANPGGATW